MLIRRIRQPRSSPSRDLDQRFLDLDGRCFTVRTSEAGRPRLILMFIMRRALGVTDETAYSVERSRLLCDCISDINVTALQLYDPDEFYERLGRHPRVLEGFERRLNQWAFEGPEFLADATHADRFVAWLDDIGYRDDARATFANILSYHGPDAESDAPYTTEDPGAPRT